jgi:hypothetical protein
MPGRIRNTKSLAKRIDRGYLKRLFPLAMWRRTLTTAFLIVGLGWLGLYAISRDQTPYSAGALTRAHAFLGDKCSACHGAELAAGSKAADARCTACHDGPVHQTTQTFNPACATCHVEHRGAAQLAAATDSSCVECHGNLETKSGRLTVAARIQSFSSGHPQFAVLRDRDADTTNIRFNHQKHVGKDVGQKCSDCHQPAILAPGPHSHVTSKAAMGLPKYADNCAACHPLNFDDKITEAAPHDQPAVVHRFVTEQLSKYIAAHPADLGKDGTPVNAVAWVKFRTEAAEKQLWGETCARCHDMKETVVKAANFKSRWFNKAQFDHSAHQELTCISCHAEAMTSTSASDVMLPGIQVCRQCHNSERNSAGANCSMCHVYHDWSKEKAVEGKFMIGH